MEQQLHINLIIINKQTLREHSRGKSNCIDLSLTCMDDAQLKFQEDGYIKIPNLVYCEFAIKFRPKSGLVFLEIHCHKNSVTWRFER